MMRKAICLLLAACFLCLAPLAAVRAEIYMDQDPPAGWADIPTLRLTAFQTKLNDCTLLEVGGKSMLIDGGVGKWRELLTKALAELGWDGYVDILYNSHPHDDHLQAVCYMLRNGFRAGQFISTFPEDYRNSLQAKTVRALKEAEIPYHQLEYGEEMDFGGAHLTFWFWDGGKDPNARSSVMKAEFGETAILMTGDTTGESQRHLHEALGPALKADVMKMPHHGIVALVSEFLDDVSPSFVFTSNWKQNTKKTSAQMERRKIHHLYSIHGRIVMVTDGKDWYIRQYKDEF